MPAGIIILLIFIGIVGIPTLVVFLVLWAARSSRERKKKSYTGFTEGIISEIRMKGGDAATVLYVDYQADGKTYRIKETMKVKGEAIKAGKMPIGQRTKPVLGDIAKGSCVSVQYDVANPQKAIIVGNDGSRTD